MRKITTFSKRFGLHRSQYELDFVDIPMGSGDIRLFIDPYAISKREDHWSMECHNLIVGFFQDVLDCVRNGNKTEALRLLDGLHEPNQTRLGFSKGKKPRGRGIGVKHADSLYFALANSVAIKTGVITDLMECELLLDGVGDDKISDLTTNIIKINLIEYTQNQCNLLGIPMRKDVSVRHVWNRNKKEWESLSVDLPVYEDEAIILVPKAIVRRKNELNHKDYYIHSVLPYLQQEHLNANSSLVRTLKTGEKRPPHKKTLSEIHPLSKKYLTSFSMEHPEVLKDYKRRHGVRKDDIPVDVLNNVIYRNQVSDTQKSTHVFDGLVEWIEKIPVGPTGATEFHEFVKSALTAIFYPLLINPLKEVEIHEGRKRIDIMFQNTESEGFFLELAEEKKIPCPFVFVECKNYSNDPANPELDQLSGRFAVNRGRFGFLVCRNFKKQGTLYSTMCRYS